MTDMGISEGRRLDSLCECKGSGVTINGQTQMFVDNVLMGMKDAVTCVNNYSYQLAPAG